MSHPNGYIETMHETISFTFNCCYAFFPYYGILFSLYYRILFSIYCKVCILTYMMSCDVYLILRDLKIIEIIIIGVWFLFFSCFCLATQV